jgi:ribosomal protein L7/L12
MDQSSAPTFSIIIKTIPSDSDERSNFLDAFSDKFHLNQELCQDILASVPVAIFSELSRGQVSDVKPSLTSLSERFDTQFFITSSSVSTLPALSWPEHPDFDAPESDRIFSDVELTRRNDSVVCPECDHILVLDQSEERTTAEKLVNLPVSDTSDKQEQEPKGETLDDDLEQEINEELDSELEEDIEEELEELLDDEGFSDAESSTTEEESESETPAQGASDKERDTAETQTPSTEASSTDHSSESSNGSANVFLSGVPDASMDEILELLTEVRDCPVSEAEKLMDRPITPIKNGVTEEEAEQLEERFNEIGVTVNIVYK